MGRDEAQDGVGAINARTAIGAQMIDLEDARQFVGEGQGRLTGIGQERRVRRARIARPIVTGEQQKQQPTDAHWPAHPPPSMRSTRPRPSLKGTLPDTGSPSLLVTLLAA